MLFFFVGKNKGHQVGDNYKGEKTINVFAKQIEDSPRQVQRYIRLTGLIPELLKRLDEGELSINPAVELTFLSPKEQRTLLVNGAILSQGGSFAGSAALLVFDVVAGGLIGGVAFVIMMVRGVVSVVRAVCGYADNA